MEPTARLTPHEEIDALRQRLEKAQCDRDVWRASGRQEKYLEAYSMVEALEMQLSQLVQAANRPPSLRYPGIA